VAAVGVLLAAGAVVALPSATEPVRTPPAEPTPAPGGLAAVLPGPPYDRLPGRTPIPEPTFLADRLLRGSLPAVGAAGGRAATASARLVLGRYCRRPQMYAVTLDPEDGWRRLRALAIRLDRSTSPPWVVLELAWTGRSYRWTGRSVQLNPC